MGFFFSLRGGGSIAGFRPEGGGSIAGCPTDVRLMHPWVQPGFLGEGASICVETLRNFGKCVEIPKFHKSTFYYILLQYIPKISKIVLEFFCDFLL